MWPDDDDEVVITYSNKTVIELGVNDKYKNGAEVKDQTIYSDFQFWTKKLHRNITQLDNDKITLTNKFYEIHGQANLNNVDVTDWAVNDLVQFRAGMHNTKLSRDWSILNVKYPGKGVATTDKSFDCTDAFH
jgi:hypothetical protein